MTIHQFILTSISDFFLLSEVATMQQSDSITHKLKLRLFYKFVHLRANSIDFHSQCEPQLIVLLDFQVCCCFWAVLFVKFSVTVLSAKQIFHTSSPMGFSHYSSSTHSGSTLVLLLGISFNTILYFSNNLIYLPNAP